MAETPANECEELPIVAATSAVRGALSERGASMVEYALLLALIAIVAVGALTTFGSGLGEEYDDINSEIEDAINP